MLSFEQHGISGMEVEVRILVKLQTSRYLLLIALVLHWLHGYGMMLQLRGTLIRQDAALKD